VLDLAELIIRHVPEYPADATFGAAKKENGSRRPLPPTFSKLEPLTVPPGLR